MDRLDPAAAGGATELAAEGGKAKEENDALVGHPADIALSAYQYRADRKPEENSPESWLALMHHAGMPLNKPVDLNAPPIKRVLCALLWEEIRPIRRVELIWAADAKNRPKAAPMKSVTVDGKEWMAFDKDKETVELKGLAGTVAVRMNY